METRAFVIFVVCLALTISVYGQTSLTKGVGNKETVFVDKLLIASSIQDLARANQKELELKRFSEVLQAEFVSALNGTAQFQLVDRSRLTSLQEEQKLTELGQIDPNDKNAAKALSLAGAKFAFQPQLTAYEDRSLTATYQKVGRSSMERKIFASAIVQVVDTTKGTLLPDSPSVELEEFEVIDMARPGQPMESDQVVVKLAKRMANLLSQQVTAYIRPAKILTITGSQLMINRGTEAGFTKGSKVEVYAVQEIIDPDTGDTYRNEVPVGGGTISRAEPKQSFAMIEGENNGIAAGCVVKVTQQDRAIEPDSPSMGSQISPGSSDKPISFD